MKTSLHHQRLSRPSQRGSAVVVVFALLVIMMMLAAINTVTLNWLKSEVRLVDKRQTTRLTTPHANPSTAVATTTNTPTAK
jgi:hypothetical protein